MKVVTTETTIEKLTRAIVDAMPGLNETEQRIAVTLYRTLAKGQPVEHAEIAGCTNLAESHVDEVLGSWPGVFYDDEGRVIGFWGLALQDMPHRLEVGGTEIHTWCAWDPLFIGPLLGKPGHVESLDPVSGEKLSLTVTPEGVENLSHEDAVVSFLIPDKPWDQNVIQEFCHFVLFVTTRETGERWVAEHEGTLLLSVDDAYEIGRRTNALQFGNALGELS